MKYPETTNNRMDTSLRLTPVSVIIPRKSLDEPIEECLQSLKNQDYSERYEVIIVTGGTIPHAKNRGLMEANGRLIAFTDSDCMATENWLSNITSQLEELDAAGLGGPGISPPNCDSFAQAIDCVYSSYIGSLGSISLKTPDKVHRTNSLSTHNCIYRKAVLDQVGGFDERYLMNEDTDLSNRVIEQGYELYVTPDAVVYHKRKKTLGEFTWKFYEYGISRMRATLTDSKNIDARILGLLVFFLATIYTLIQSSNYSYMVTVLYLAILTLHGVYYSVMKRQLVYLILIPLLYTLLHLGYALGLLTGIIKGKYQKIEDLSKTTVTKQIFK